MMLALRNPVFEATSTSVRWLEPSFGGVCAAIHATGFFHPWSENEFQSLLAAEATLALGVFESTPDNSCELFLKPRLKGFIIGQIAADEAEILTFAVSPPSQRQGTGTLLLQSLKSEMAAKDVKTIFLEVDEANQAARALYEKCDFRLAGIRKSYYRTKENQRSNAIIMTAGLSRPLPCVEALGHGT